MPSSHASANVAFGLTVGILMASGYSVIAILVYLVGGAEAFERNEVTFASVIAAYWVGAMGSGVLLGVLRPSMGSRTSAMVAGPFIAAPAVASLGVTISGMPWHWQTETIATFVIVCLIFGVYGGFVFGPASAR